MIIQPLPESKAEGKTKENYQRIIKALNIDFLPVFFQYLGPFPEYLDYITNQLVQNLQSQKFKEFVDQIGAEIKKSINESLPKSDGIREWLQRYRYSPQFYNFETNLRTIFITNIKLAFIFIALREAVKGWAVAARQISGRTVTGEQIKNEVFYKQEDNVFEGLSYEIKNQIISPSQSFSLQNRSEIPLEKQLLPEYLNLCRLHFFGQTKKENYLILRLGLEKLFLSSLPILPELIYSPINVVLKHIGKYPNYPELLYLLSEHFPVLAVQKVIFSGFLM